jgi:hypothetical protein
MECMTVAKTDDGGSRDGLTVFLARLERPERERLAAIQRAAENAAGRAVSNTDIVRIAMPLLEAKYGVQPGAAALAARPKRRGRPRGSGAKAK